MFPPGALVRDVEAPERGVGRVLRYDPEQRAAEVLYEGSEQPHVVRPGSTVKRLALHPGQGARTKQGQEGRVLGFLEREEDEPWYYRVEVGGAELELCEADLEPLGPASSDPLDLLRALRWRGGWRFFARWNLADKVASWAGEAEGLSAWLAERRAPAPAALAAARRFVFLPEPRGVIALPTPRERRDALGLIWLALAHDWPEARALVIVPGGATRSWAARLFLDHGGRAMTHLDLGRWQQTPDFLRDEVLGAAPGLVVSAAALAWDPELRDALTMFPWQLVAVEGGQLLEGELAEWVEEVAAGAEAGLCLVPSPAELEADAVAGWLSLAGAQVEAATLARRAAEVALWAARCPLQGDDAALLAGAREALADDPYAQARVAAGDAEGLRIYLSEERGCDPRLIVGRGPGAAPEEPEQVALPADLGELAWLEQLAQLPLAGDDPLALAYRERLAEATAAGPRAVRALLEARGRALPAGRESPTLAGALALQPSAGELDLLLPELLAAAPAGPGEAAWIEQAREHVAQWERAGWSALGALVERIEDHLVDGGEGAVISVLGGGAAVERVAEALAEQLGEEAVIALHDGQDETTRAEALQTFRSQASCCVLVSDPIAAGARRVGAAELFVRLGLPLEPAARDWAELSGPTQELVLRSDAPWSEALAAPLAPAGAWAWPAGRRALSRAVPEPAGLAGPWGAAAAQPLAAAHDLAPSRLSEAEALGEVLEEASLEGDAQELRAWARSVRIRLDASGQREWSATWRADGLARPLPGLPQEGSADRRRARGTFDPIVAREREGLGVFAPGHPLIDALVRDACDSQSDGRLTVIRRELGPAFPGRLALVVVARCRPDVDGLPRGLQRLAERRLWAEPTADVVALFPGKQPLARGVDDRAARGIALAPFVGKEVEPKVDPDVLCEALPLDRLLAAVEAGVALALERVRAERAPLAEDAAAQLEADLAPRRAGASRRREDDEDLERLLAGVRRERVELDALALLVG